MKHLLSGVAMAAALAIAAPVWAQQNGPMGQNAPSAQNAPMTPSGSAPRGTAAASSGGMEKPMAAHHASRGHRAMRHVSHHRSMHGMRGGGGGGGDRMTEELNRQELQRLQSGNMPAPPPSGGGMQGGMAGQPGGMQGGTGGMGGQPGMGQPGMGGQPGMMPSGGGPAYGSPK